MQNITPFTMYRDYPFKNKRILPIISFNLLVPNDMKRCYIKSINFKTLIIASETYEYAYSSDFHKINTPIYLYTLDKNSLVGMMIIEKYISYPLDFSIDDTELLETTFYSESLDGVRNFYVQKTKLKKNIILEGENVTITQTGNILRFDAYVEPKVDNYLKSFDGNTVGKHNTIYSQNILKVSGNEFGTVIHDSNLLCPIAYEPDSIGPQGDIGPIGENGTAGNDAYGYFYLPEDCLGSCDCYTKIPVANCINEYDTYSKEACEIEPLSCGEIDSFDFSDGDGGDGCTVCDQEDSEEIIMTDCIIKVDHKTIKNYSTKIYDVKSSGEPDPSNVGTTKDFLFNETNKTSIHTNAQYKMLETTKNCPMEFINDVYPESEIVVPSEPAKYEIQLVHDVTKNKWRWFCIGESAGLKFAKIAWRFDTGPDLSIGEILLYDANLDIFNPTGAAVWIDRAKSGQAQFSTAGNDTIFTIKKVRNNVNRGGEIHDLYYATQCIWNQGVAITHLSTVTKSAPFVLGKILSDELANPVWSDPVTATITTNICGSDIENGMSCQVPREWDLLTVGFNYHYVELHDISKGMEFYMRPIRPVSTGVDKEFESAEQIGGTPIATYKKA